MKTRKKRIRGVRVPYTAETCPECRKIRKREKLRKKAHHKPPKSDIPPVVNRELDKLHRELWEADDWGSEAYRQRMKKINDVYRFWGEYEEELKERRKRRKVKMKEKKRERRGRKIRNESGL